MNFFFHPAAEAEHLESIEFYETARPGWGRLYFEEVDAALERACSNTQIYPVTRPPAIRSIVLRRFPHTIHFRVRKEAIEVLAVAHQSRRPGYWLGRIRRPD